MSSQVGVRGLADFDSEQEVQRTAEKVDGKHTVICRKIGVDGRVLGRVTFTDKTLVQAAIEASKMLGCGKWRLLMVGAGPLNDGVWFDITTREETRIVCGPLRDDSCN